MKSRFKLLTVLFLGLILFTGCPYESQVPIDKPNVKIDINWLGKWESADGEKNPDGSNPIYYMTKKSDFVYGLSTSYDEFDEFGTKTKVTTYYEGHVSTIGTTNFFNLKRQADEINTDPGYLLFKIELAGSTAILSEVSNCINKNFSSSSELKSFLERNLNNELLFTGTQTFFKQ